MLDKRVIAIEDIGTVDVLVTDFENMSDEEIIHYIKGIMKDDGINAILSLHISKAEDGQVALSYVVRQQKFERIRRITGLS